MLEGEFGFFVRVPLCLPVNMSFFTFVICNTGCPVRALQPHQIHTTIYLKDFLYHEKNNKIKK